VSFVFLALRGHARENGASAQKINEKTRERKDENKERGRKRQGEREGKREGKEKKGYVEGKKRRKGRGGENQIISTTFNKKNVPRIICKSNCSLSHYQLSSYAHNAIHVINARGTESFATLK